MTEEEEGSRNFEDLEVSVMGGESVALRPARVDVRLRGPRARIDDLHPRRVVPFVDVSALDPDRGAQPLAVQIRGLPDGIVGTPDPAEVLAVPAR